jgi:hypothetical protein
MEDSNPGVSQVLFIRRQWCSAEGRKQQLYALPRIIKTGSQDKALGSCEQPGPSIYVKFQSQNQVVWWNDSNGKAPA